MALHWTIDSRAKLMVVVADGAVDRADLDRLLDVIVGSNLKGYRKLFDGSKGETQLGPLDLLAVGVRIRSLQSAGTTRGPLAFVVPDDKYWLVAGLLGILAIPKRPMRVFKEAQKARAWLDSPAVIAKTPG
ncbi:MAG: hypothetical protein HQ465_08230 [Rhodospirillales bacterium]|nr:hypothetical protein [Rhodospirillales bacterium]